MPGSSFRGCALASNAPNGASRRDRPAVPGSDKVTFANATVMSGSGPLELNQGTVFTITVQD